MGEEEKKPPSEEEKKPEEGEKPKDEGKEKGEESKKGDSKEEKSERGKDKEIPPSDEIVLRVYMHCEGCARKVRRCLRRVEGVEDVQVDCKEHKVVVKGKKADPLKVLDTVQRKSHRKVELLTPLPKPSTEKNKAGDKEKPKAEDKKEKLPAIVVVLKVHMHCEACAEEIRKRIMKMKGVQEATPDLKSSQVRVKGTFQAAEVVEYVYKRTGKHAIIVKQEVGKIEEEKGKEGKEEKKGEGEEGNKAKVEKGGEEAKEGGGGGGGEGEGEGEMTTKADVKKYEYLHTFYQHQDPLYAVEYVYPPQIFSDENPNACSVM